MWNKSNVQLSIRTIIPMISEVNNNNDNNNNNNNNNNSMALVHERTIPTERPPLVGEVSANFSRIVGATSSAWQIPMAVFSVTLLNSAPHHRDISASLLALVVGSGQFHTLAALLTG
jgi:hypothetical protein